MRNAALFSGLIGMLVVLPSLAQSQYQSFDGSNNSPNGWGRADSPFLRLAFPAYADGLSTPAGPTRPNPRRISNAVSAQQNLPPNNRNLSDFIWQWGQFLDHDVTLSDFAHPAEPLPIMVLDEADPLFPVIPLVRTRYDASTGITSPRQQLNTTTPLVDASMVYGPSLERATTLRTSTGGRLRTRADDLLPLNTFGLENANEGPFPGDELVVGGDVRAPEQPALTCMHTLFLREHNRWADQIAAGDSGLTDEEIFQQARRMVIAEVQVITYQEFLPALLGPYAPSLEGQSHDPTTPAVFLNEMAGALYRLGHTLISSNLQRIQNDGQPAPGGALGLRDGFFNPLIITNSLEVDYFLKGLSKQLAQEVDPLVIDDLRNFLFGPPGAGGLDLISLNIQRSRDHGLPDYNTLRRVLGLRPAGSFSEVTSDPDHQAALASVYASPDEIDPWIGAMSEDHLPGASVGELLAAALHLQYRNLMVGDRHFFLWHPSLSPAEISALRQTRLSDIIKRNTGISNIQDEVFFNFDLDEDGMPNDWELAHGLDPNSAHDAELDLDGDGLSNLAEYQAGTIPTDPTSLLTLGMIYLGDSVARLNFLALPDRSYAIDYRDDMMLTGWTNLARVPQADHERAVEVTDEMSPAPGHRFYRLRTP